MSIEHFNSIFGFTVCHELPINDLIKVNRVCKKWRSISNGYIDQAFQSCLMQLIRSNAFEQRYNKKAKEDL